MGPVENLHFICGPQIGSGKKSWLCFPKSCSTTHSPLPLTFLKHNCCQWWNARIPLSHHKYYSGSPLGLQDFRVQFWTDLWDSTFSGEHLSFVKNPKCLRNCLSEGITPSITQMQHSSCLSLHRNFTQKPGTGIKPENYTQLIMQKKFNKKVVPPTGLQYKLHCWKILLESLLITRNWGLILLT